MQNQWRKNINEISFEGFKEIIHYNKEMEAAVLGACMLEKNAFSLVRGILMKDVFYSEGHKLFLKLFRKCGKRIFQLKF